MSRKNREHKTGSFFTSFGYYVVIAVLVIGLGFVYVEDHSRQKEREIYRQSLMEDETAEKIGSIEVTEPVVSKKLERDFSESEEAGQKETDSDTSKESQNNS